jgi:putative ABC transport system permease protein
MTEAQQKQLGQEIEARLRTDGYDIADITTGKFLKNASADGLTILTGFLLFMASLTAMVGSIGLTGTMSMNVLERTREIGVMRAIGANNRILMTMVIVEAVIIGFISWVLGCLMAFPISKIMSDTISMAIFDAPSNFAFTTTGFIVWFFVVLILSILASVGPARNAARLTIREVLAYE